MISIAAKPFNLEEVLYVNGVVVFAGKYISLKELRYDICIVLMPAG